MIGILGGYQTRFNELWQMSLEDLIIEAGEGAMKDALVKKNEIDLVIVGNKLSGRLEGQDHLGSLATNALKINAPGFRVEAACASGGVAVYEGVKAVLADRFKKVLVIGVEKMTDRKNGEISQALMGAASEEERRAGLSFAGLYALMARRYMEEFGVTKRDLARVAVMNHRNASFNSKAHFQGEISMEMVLEAQMVAEPLGLFDCSPISDGAAAVVIGETEKGVGILASEMATDSLGLAERESLVELKATKEASQRAYRVAGISPREIEVAEVHDCFTIAQVMALRDLGFSKKDRVLVNTSGGLKAGGHPVGATGVKQVVEVYKQLSSKAGERQVRGAKIGLTHNVGGTGGTVVVHILKKI